MNAIDLMAKQLIEHPLTSNGIVVHSYQFAQYFIRELGAALAYPKMKFGQDKLRFDPTGEKIDWLFTAYIQGEKKIIGSRITGLLLVDVYDVEERYWQNTALPIVTSAGNWLPIHARSIWAVLDKQQVIDTWEKLN